VVNDEVLQADKIFINVGGRASVPPIPGIHDVSFLTNSSMMDVDFLPEHLVIVGGSYVGLEFAQMYRRVAAAVFIPIYAAFDALAGLRNSTAREALVYVVYGNVVPNDFWVFDGVDVKRESLPWCKVTNGCAPFSDNLAVFIKPPDIDPNLVRFFLSVAGDFAVNPNGRLILTCA
jgi:hypothetical protein